MVSKNLNFLTSILYQSDSRMVSLHNSILNTMTSKTMSYQHGSFFFESFARREMIHQHSQYLIILWTYSYKKDASHQHWDHNFQSMWRCYPESRPQSSLLMTEAQPSWKNSQIKAIYSLFSWIPAHGTLHKTAPLTVFKNKQKNLKTRWSCHR